MFPCRLLSLSMTVDRLLIFKVVVVLPFFSLRLADSYSFNILWFLWILVVYSSRIYWHFLCIQFQSYVLYFFFLFSFVVLVRFTLWWFANVLLFAFLFIWIGGSWIICIGCCGCEYWRLGLGGCLWRCDCCCLLLGTGLDRVFQAEWGECYWLFEFVPIHAYFHEFPVCF